MTTRAEIVAAAREYIDTPYLHQGRLKGVGIDCAGLLICVARDIGSRDVTITGYSMQPNEEQFRESVRAYLTEITFPQLLPADVLTFRFIAEQHLAIVTKIDPLTIVHAHMSAGKCIEHELDRVWMYRLRGCYRFPEVED